MKLEELEFVFKTKFNINLENYPKGWKLKDVINAEIDAFYNDPKGYVELLIDEDEYEIEIS